MNIVKGSSMKHWEVKFNTCSYLGDCRTWEMGEHKLEIELEGGGASNLNQQKWGERSTPSPLNLLPAKALHAVAILCQSRHSFRKIKEFSSSVKFNNGI